MGESEQEVSHSGSYVTQDLEEASTEEELGVFLASGTVNLVWKWKKSMTFT